MQGTHQGHTRWHVLRVCVSRIIEKWMCLKTWQQNLRVLLNEQKGKHFFTVYKYTHMTRVVTERLWIIIVPLPVLYNHTNHLASMFCGPDIHSVALYLLSSRSQVVYCLTNRWNYTKNFWTFKISWVYGTLRYTPKCNLNYSRNKSACVSYASFLQNIYVCNMHSAQNF